MVVITIQIQEVDSRMSVSATQDMTENATEKEIAVANGVCAMVFNPHQGSVLSVLNFSEILRQRIEEGGAEFKGTPIEEALKKAKRTKKK